MRTQEQLAKAIQSFGCETVIQGDMTSLKYGNGFTEKGILVEIGKTDELLAMKLDDLDDVIYACIRKQMNGN